MPQQDPNVRNKNFKEVALGYTEEMAVEEAQRCLNCKHMPCVSGCPVNVHIPQFIAHVAKGEFEQAYQEILGDMHNLFGDTNAVHVSVNEKGYNIEQIIDGETVAEVLDYVQYNPKKLVRTLETWVTKSVKEGKISLEEGKEFLSNYRSGLYGYTYLE